MAFSMFSSFVATIILAKELSIENFGFFNLIKTILPMFSIIALLGLDKSFVKQYSKISKYKIIHLVAIMIFIIAIPVAYIVSSIYSLEDYLIYILLSIAFGAINMFL